MTFIGRSARLVSDLTSVMRAYLVSPAFRRSAMQALASPSTPLELSSATRLELGRAPDAASPYAGASGAALALSVLGTGAPVARIRLVLSDLDPDRLFAGVATALAAAAGLAERSEMPIDVVVLSEAIDAGRRSSLVDAVASRTGLPAHRVSVTLRADLLSERSHPADVWIVTHWTTAHPAVVAVRAGVLDASRIVYLVQDYEPGFFPLSADSVTARSTYHAGFLHLVNSSPVAAVLTREEGVDLDARLVFGPDLDLERLAALRARRAGSTEADAPRTILFYGRPSKPRNLFALGIAALRIAARDLEGVPLRFVSAGEAHRSIDLGGGHRLESVGTLGWDAYFGLLGDAEVVLSLQASPHPSHPPLEAALSGAIAVTNEVAGTRGALHPGLRAVAGDPLELGRAVVEALAGPRPGPTPIDLGGPLGAALDRAADILGLADCDPGS